jgi:RNA polymerase sigma-70 factor (ECF subfamily)
VFDFEYREIAEIVGKDEAACRQAFHRARQHINEQRSRFRASAEARERLTERFLEACLNGSVEAFTSLLAEDVVSIADGGGKVTGAGLYPVVGREKVARLYSGLVHRAPANITAEIASINGVPAIVSWVDGEVFSVILLETDGQFITQICNVVNPDKLRHVQQPDADANGN